MINLKDVLAKHQKWLNCEPDGERADLTRANLTRADLTRADLYGANLYGANLYGATNVPYIPMTCPDEGEYTAYKKMSLR